MKIALLTLLVVTLSVSAVFAQEFGFGGVHRAGTNTVMKQRMKEKLKSELKLTDDQVNSVTVIQQDYQLKARAVKMDTKTSDEQKLTLLQPIEDERKQKLRKILSDEQITKLDDLLKNMNQPIQQRQAQ